MAAQIKVDPEEQEFRKKIQWHSFVSRAWGGLAGASFFGALVTLAQALMSTAASVGTAENVMLAASSSMLNPLPLAVLGGLAAFGLLATYMSQREETELKVLSDEHQARLNAKSMAPGKGIEQAQTIEYPQNQRADGKTWVEATNRGQPQIASTRIQ